MAPKILLIGYGNPGRGDDGLGPEIAEKVGSWRLPNVETKACFQLNIEDAEAAARSDIVLFVDAARLGPEPFSILPVQKESSVSCSTHTLSPGGVVALASEVFKLTPKSFILAVRGYVFDVFENGLSQGAKKNLESTLAFFSELLKLNEESSIISVLQSRSLSGGKSHE